MGPAQRRKARSQVALVLCEGEFEMARAKKRFSDELLAYFQGLSVIDSLDLMDVRWKRDATFVPTKSTGTALLFVQPDSMRSFTLLANGPKFYDSAVEHGGGGGIDLAMHLFGADFVAAVKLLEVALSKKNGVSVPSRDSRTRPREPG